MNKSYSNDSKSQNYPQRMKEHATSAILGVCVADALGVPVEGYRREDLDKNPVTGMREYGTWNQPRGTWSDDSSLTLALAESIADTGWNLRDQGSRFVRWLCYSHKDGYMTPHGYVFDAGNTTRNAIYALMNNLDDHDYDPRAAGPIYEMSQGNGSLMRIIPSIFGLLDQSVKSRLHKTAYASQLTHGHRTCQLACALYAEIGHNILDGYEFVPAYDIAVTNTLQHFKDTQWAESKADLSRVFDKSIMDAPREDIRSSCYIVDSIEAAIWCLSNSTDYSEAVLKAVNLGRDTDTIGAITGGLAGLIYGSASIPQEWISTLAKSEFIYELAERLGSRAAKIQKSH